ncbi:hypothetical protein, variant 1 [Sphaeroforma arctica JP610]|uniref:Uncharacterized protein n=1 Tax=Sphaeroforma arctica JP610 TaxID=667725 RepID=A0A0L0FWW7_9EUKA|nr:hypothetical protein, variant 1 [Sphaeroforma arctica JP610]KNC81335.1 hypothetical protein, variant 1 [Sphaeroforma arctica JP610]|eukprot:XP_014155237.1 hypothetical protein, variant 1 [Sphaeroforma arctica JP610]
MSDKLWQAVFNKDIGAVERLCKEGVSLDTLNWHNPAIKNWTCLHIAASTGQVEILRLLVNAGADLHPKSKNGSRPLHFAALSLNLDAVQTLLDAGARINALDKQKNTVLHRAVMKHHIQMAKLLLDNHANPQMRNKKGLSPIDLAVETCDRDLINCFGGAAGIGGTAENMPLPLPDLRQLNEDCIGDTLREDTDTNTHGSAQPSHLTAQLGQAKIRQPSGWIGGQAAYPQNNIFAPFALDSTPAARFGLYGSGTGWDQGQGQGSGPGSTASGDTPAYSSQSPAQNSSVQNEPAVGNVHDYGAQQQQAPSGKMYTPAMTEPQRRESESFVAQTGQPIARPLVPPGLDQVGYGSSQANQGLDLAGFGSRKPSLVLDQAAENGEGADAPVAENTWEAENEGWGSVDALDTFPAQSQDAHLGAGGDGEEHPAARGLEVGSHKEVEGYSVGSHNTAPSLNSSAVQPSATTAVGPLSTGADAPTTSQGSGHVDQEVSEEMARADDGWDDESAQTDDGWGAESSDWGDGDALEATEEPSTEVDVDGVDSAQSMGAGAADDVVGDKPNSMGVSAADGTVRQVYAEDSGSVAEQSTEALAGTQEDLDDGMRGDMNDDTIEASGESRNNAYAQQREHSLENDTSRTHAEMEDGMLQMEVADGAQGEDLTEGQTADYTDAKGEEYAEAEVEDDSQARDENQVHDQTTPPEEPAVQIQDQDQEEEAYAMDLTDEAQDGWGEDGDVWGDEYSLQLSDGIRTDKAAYMLEVSSDDGGAVEVPEETEDSTEHLLGGESTEHHEGEADAESSVTEETSGELVGGASAAQQPVAEESESIGQVGAEGNAQHTTVDEGAGVVAEGTPELPVVDESAEQLVAGTSTGQFEAEVSSHYPVEEDSVPVSLGQGALNDGTGDLEQTDGDGWGTEDAQWSDDDGLEVEAAADLAMPLSHTQENSTEKKNDVSSYFGSGVQGAEHGEVMGDTHDSFSLSSTNGDNASERDIDGVYGSALEHQGTADAKHGDGADSTDWTVNGDNVDEVDDVVAGESELEEIILPTDTGDGPGAENVINVLDATVENQPATEAVPGQSEHSAYPVDNGAQAGAAEDSTAAPVSTHASADDALAHTQSTDAGAPADNGWDTTEDTWGDERANENENDMQSLDAGSATETIAAPTGHAGGLSSYFGEKSGEDHTGVFADVREGSQVQTGAALGHEAEGLANQGEDGWEADGDNWDDAGEMEMAADPEALAETPGTDTNLSNYFGGSVDMEGSGERELPHAVDTYQSDGDGEATHSIAAADTAESGWDVPDTDTWGQVDSENVAPTTETPPEPPASDQGVSGYVGEGTTSAADSMFAQATAEDKDVRSDENALVVDTPIAQGEDGWGVDEGAWDGDGAETEGISEASGYETVSVYGESVSHANEGDDAPAETSEDGAVAATQEERVSQDQETPSTQAEDGWTAEGEGWDEEGAGVEIAPDTQTVEKPSVESANLSNYFGDGMGEQGQAHMEHTDTTDAEAQTTRTEDGWEAEGEGWDEEGAGVEIAPDTKTVEEPSVESTNMSNYFGDGVGGPEQSHPDNTEAVINEVYALDSEKSVAQAEDEWEAEGEGWGEDGAVEVAPDTEAATETPVEGSTSAYLLGDGGGVPEQAQTDDTDTIHADAQVQHSETLETSAARAEDGWEAEGEGWGEDDAVEVAPDTEVTVEGIAEDIYSPNSLGEGGGVKEQAQPSTTDVVVNEVDVLDSQTPAAQAEDGWEAEGWDEAETVEMGADIQAAVEPPALGTSISNYFGGDVGVQAQGGVAGAPDTADLSSYFGQASGAQQSEGLFGTNATTETAEAPADNNKPNNMSNYFGTGAEVQGQGTNPEPTGHADMSSYFGEGSGVTVQKDSTDTAESNSMANYFGFSAGAQKPDDAADASTSSPVSGYYGNGMGVHGLVGKPDKAINDDTYNYFGNTAGIQAQQATSTVTAHAPETLTDQTVLPTQADDGRGAEGEGWGGEDAVDMVSSTDAAMGNIVDYTDTNSSNYTGESAGVQAQPRVENAVDMSDAVHDETSIHALDTQTTQMEDGWEAEGDGWHSNETVELAPETAAAAETPGEGTSLSSYFASSSVSDGVSAVAQPDEEDQTRIPEGAAGVPGDALEYVNDTTDVNAPGSGDGSTTVCTSGYGEDSASLNPIDAAVYEDSTPEWDAGSEGWVDVGSHEPSVDTSVGRAGDSATKASESVRGVAGEERLREELARFAHELEVLRELNAALNVSLENRDDQIRVLEKNVVEQQDELLARDSERLESRASSQHDLDVARESETRLQEIIEDKDEELRSMEATLAELLDESEAKESEFNEQLALVHQELDNSRETEGELQAALQEKDEQIKTLQSNLSTVEEQLDVIDNDKGEELAQAQQQQEISRESEAMLTDALVDKEDRIVELEAEVQSLQHELDSRDSLLRTAEADVETLRSERDDELEEVTEMLALATEGEVDATAKLEAKEDELAERASELDELRTNVKELEDQCLDQDAELSELKPRLEDCLNEMATLREQLRTMRSRIDAPPTHSTKEPHTRALSPPLEDADDQLTISLEDLQTSPAEGEQSLGNPEQVHLLSQQESTRTQHPLGMDTDVSAGLDNQAVGESLPVDAESMAGGYNVSMDDSDGEYDQCLERLLERAQAQGEYDDLEELLSQATTDGVESIDTLLERMRSTKVDADAEVIEMRAARDKALAENAEKSVHLAELQERVVDLQAANTDLQSRIQHMEGQVNPDGSDVLGVELLAARNELANKDAALSEARAMVAELESAVAAAQAVHQQHQSEVDNNISDAETQLAELREQVADLQATNADLQSRIHYLEAQTNPDELDQVKQEFLAAQTSLAHRDGELRDARARISELESVAATAQEMRPQKPETNSTRSDAEAQLADLQEQIAGLNTVNTDLQARIQDLQTQVFSDELGEVCQELLAARNELAIKDDELREARARVSQLETEAQTAQDIRSLGTESNQVGGDGSLGLPSFKLEKRVFYQQQSAMLDELLAICDEI